MTAYSFRPRFVELIYAGTKRQTIRALRLRNRHARPGEEVQLYTGMRTSRCRLIGRATCLTVSPIELRFAGDLEGYSHSWSESRPDPRFASWRQHKQECNAFAFADGFLNWKDLKAFWAAEHPGIECFEGVLIKWGPLK